MSFHFDTLTYSLLLPINATYLEGKQQMAMLQSSVRTNWVSKPKEPICGIVTLNDLSYTVCRLPQKKLITEFVTRVTRRVPLMEQELLTLPEHLSPPPVFNGIRVHRPLVFCVMLCRSLFVLFHFAIVMSFLRFTDSDYSFGIFKLFLRATVPQFGLNP